MTTATLFKKVKQYKNAKQRTTTLKWTQITARNNTEPTHLQLRLLPQLQTNVMQLMSGISVWCNLLYKPLLKLTNNETYSKKKYIYG